MVTAMSSTGAEQIESDQVSEVMGSHAPLSKGRCQRVRKAVDAFLQTQLAA